MDFSKVQREQGASPHLCTLILGKKASLLFIPSPVLGLRPGFLFLPSLGRDRRKPQEPEGVTKVRIARCVPTGNFRRTERAQPSPGHRGDSSKITLRDSERFGPSAHQMRMSSASTQAHSCLVPTSRGLRAVSRPGTPGGSASLGEVVPSRSAFLLATLVLERPRGQRPLGICSPLCLQLCQE